MRNNAISCCLSVLASAALIACATVAQGQSLESAKAAYKRPDLIPFPDEARYSPQTATLGKMLFFDPRLSGKQNLSCASCHNPSFGFEVPVAGAIGATNKPLGRKAPTVLNAAWIPTLFWDGRAPNLEIQAMGPITAEGEMDGKFPEIIARLNRIPEYSAWFGKLFPKDGVTQDNILTAIATYERTVVAGTAPFDRWVEGDRARSRRPRNADSTCSRARPRAPAATRAGTSPTTSSTTSASRPRMSAVPPSSPMIRRRCTRSRRRACAT